MWDSVQNKYSASVDFERVNGDAEEAKPLKQQYAIRGYPTLIWTDATGAELKRSGYYKTAEQFAAEIDSVLSIK